jgi:predicted heme/steroid binding protein
LIAAIAVIGYDWLFPVSTPASSSSAATEEYSGPQKEEVDPPRNFTLAQLKYFDGTKDEKTGDLKPVYLSINGTIFDVTRGRDFYGPDGPYSMFAGRECGAALAKMSFDDKHLDDIDACTKLNFGEKAELDGWTEKFQYYRCYPIKGRLVPNHRLPNPDRRLTTEELAKFNGTAETPTESGYATPSIYVGAGDKVFDVSFGGVEFYGPNGSYHRFAGKDASRALAKMSFQQEDLDDTSVDDLTDAQRKVLQDWIRTFEERKTYPCVGRLGKEEGQKQ